MMDNSEYYTPDVLRRISKAKNYHDLLVIAMEILDAINNDYGSKTIIQVCGPISTGGTGSRDKNLAILSRTIDRLTADGLVVFSQMPFEDDMGRLRKSDPNQDGIGLLEGFYLPIFKSGYIDLLCFIPGWEKSLGATWEHEQAQKLDIPRVYLSDYYTRN